MPTTDYLYVMVDPDKPSACKVGRTKDPAERIKAYRTGAPKCFMYAVFTIPAGTTHSRRLEKQILSHLKDIAFVHSEYVSLAPSLVKSVIEGLISDVAVDV